MPTDEIPATPDDALEFVSKALKPKPRLMIHPADLPASARALGGLLGKSGRVFDRDGAVRIIQDAAMGMPKVQALTPYGVINEAHRLCQPVGQKDGHDFESTLSDRVARLCLDESSDWGMPVLDGITSAPLLKPDGRIFYHEGYDPDTRLWCCRTPQLDVPESPTLEEAAAALCVLRYPFRTFPFADSARLTDSKARLEIVDLSKPPGKDESAFLVGLLTAIARPSLAFAPALLVRAPKSSGSGVGKGKLGRAIFEVAYGWQPPSFTAGKKAEELEQRLSTALLAGPQGIFLDNANEIALKSDQLASALTERPARVRVLGFSRTALLNSSAFIVITGNALTLAEDLVRRCLVCELDARMENPESRPFLPGFEKTIKDQRGVLLSAALTIWRWGRQTWYLPCGIPFGGFEEWASWVRDPLMALGCTDPAKRISETKAADPERNQIAFIYDTWWAHHGDQPVKISKLEPEVGAAIDPRAANWQALVGPVGTLVGTRAAGMVLNRYIPDGKWSPNVYWLEKVVYN